MGIASTLGRLPFDLREALGLLPGVDFLERSRHCTAALDRVHLGHEQ